MVSNINFTIYYLRFTIYKVSFYPDKINKRFHTPAFAGKTAKTNATGTSASFVCGAFVRFYLEIDVSTKQIINAKFKSNGCGFAVAAADFLAEKIIGEKLTSLHGLEEKKTEIESELGKFSNNRTSCLEICIEAFAQALANFRALQIEEFAGEKPLICTCFGVSEEQIEMIISEKQAETVEEIGEFCHAGTGCGSCQFMIQAMLDVMLK